MDLHVKPDTLKLTEEKVGKGLKFLNVVSNRAINDRLTMQIEILLYLRNEDFDVSFKKIPLKLFHTCFTICFKIIHEGPLL